METADLIAALRGRADETERDRRRLVEAVAALDAEIERIDAERQLVEQLVRRYAPSEATSADDGSEPDADRVGRGSMHEPVDATTPSSWAVHKLAAAAACVAALDDLADEGRIGRVLGVEMAVDGAVASLCAAYEAAVVALTDAIESSADVPADRRTPHHLADWSKLAAAAKFFELPLASSMSVSDALIDEHSESPQGWLAQLLVLRRSSSRGDCLVDAPTRDTVAIAVPGTGPRPVLDYLATSLELMQDLVETMLRDVADLEAGKLHIPSALTAQN